MGSEVDCERLIVGHLVIATILAALSAKKQPGAEV